MSGVRSGGGEVEGVVETLASPVAEEMGLRLVDVEFVRGGGRSYLRLYIDKPGGVTLDDCEAFSREVSVLLDEADPIPGPYFLEVASPGLDRPLKKDRDYEVFKGRRVEIRTFGPLGSEGVREVRGELLGLRDGCVVVTDDQGRIWEIPKDQVARARLCEDEGF